MMVGILWKDKPVWASTTIPENPGPVIILDTDRCKKADVEIVWGWSDEYEWDWYIKCGKKYIDTILWGIVKDVEEVGIDEFEEVLRLAKKVASEYGAYFLGLENDAFRVGIRYGEFEPIIESKVKMFGSIPLDYDLDKYLKDYIEIVKKVYETHKKAVKELEEKYGVKLIFVEVV